MRCANTRRLPKRTHLLRWRPRPPAQPSPRLAGLLACGSSAPSRLEHQRTGSARVRPSGAASHLDPFEQPADLRGLVFTVLYVALALLSGLAAPAAAQGAAAAPEIAKHIAGVASSDATVQEAAAVALGKTGDRKILPLLEALREGSVYVREVPGGGKETAILGDKVSEGDKTLVPLFSAYGREPLTGADGTPLLVELSTLQDVSAGRSLRLALRPLIDAFSGQNDLRDPDPTVRKAAATKMGNGSDAGALQILSDTLTGEHDRWVRYALEEAMALIRLRTGSEVERVAAAERLGALKSVNALDRLRDLGADAQSPAPLQQAAKSAVKRIERGGLLTPASEPACQGRSLAPRRLP